MWMQPPSFPPFKGFNMNVHFSLSVNGAKELFYMLKSKGTSTKEILELIDDRIKILSDDNFQCSRCNKIFKAYKIDDLLESYSNHECKIRINLRG
jgi:hypothetical protein